MNPDKITQFDRIIQCTITIKKTLNQTLYKILILNIPLINFIMIVNI